MHTFSHFLACDKQLLCFYCILRRRPVYPNIPAMRHHHGTSAQLKDALVASGHWDDKCKRCSASVATRLWVLMAPSFSQPSLVDTSATASDGLVVHRQPDVLLGAPPCKVDSRSLCDKSHKALHQQQLTAESTSRKRLHCYATSGTGHNASSMKSYNCGCSSSNALAGLLQSHLRETLTLGGSTLFSMLTFAAYLCSL